jgi:transcriptional regulator with XRE-family HTH domain
MKEYIASKNLTIKELSNKTGIPYSTLNDIVNGKTDIGNIRFKFVKLISKELGLSLDEFNRLFCDKEESEYDFGTVYTRNKKYYMKCDLRPEPVYLCKNNLINSKYIGEIASWEYNAIKRKETMEKWKTTLSS